MARWASKGMWLVVVLGGCTSVRMVQRDGCWVKQTSQKPFGGTREELGPCATPATPWVEGDRLTRLMQECATRADGRWQSRAVTAWGRGDALPEPAGKDDILQQCMSESARVVYADEDATKREIDGLKRQLASLAAERDALRTRSDEERTALRARDDQERTALLAAQAKLADHLGEAARKAQQPASATATATTEHTSHATTTSQPPPPGPSLAVVGAAPMVVPITVSQPPSQPRAAQRQARSQARPRKAEKSAVLGAGCDTKAAASPATGEHGVVVPVAASAKPDEAAPAPGPAPAVAPADAPAVVPAAAEPAMPAAVPPPGAAETPGSSASR